MSMCKKAEFERGFSRASTAFVCTCSPGDFSPQCVTTHLVVTEHAGLQTLTVLLGTGWSVDILSRIGWRPCFIASVSVNSGRTEVVAYALDAWTCVFAHFFLQKRIFFVTWCVFSRVFFWQSKFAIPRMNWDALVLVGNTHFSEANIPMFYSFLRLIFQKPCAKAE